MKKIFATLFAASLMLMGTQAFAQIVPGAGYLHVFETTKFLNNENADPDVDHLNGFYVGASYNIPIVDHVGFAPGFYVNMLFANIDIYGGSSIVGNTYSQRYSEIALNVPLNFAFKYEFNGNAAIVATVGPTFQYGVMSRSSVHDDLTVGPIHIPTDGSINHYDKEHADEVAPFYSVYNPFNIYIGANVGVQLGDLLFTVGYDRSLLDCDVQKNNKTVRNVIKAGINFAF